MAGSRGTRGARVRGLAAKTSGKQRAGAGVAAVLLATAPFGGLQATAKPPVAEVRADHPIQVGPFDLDVEKVVTVGDLRPSAEPQIDGDRLVAVVGTVANPGRRPEYATTLTGALRLRGAGVVGKEQGGLAPQLLSYDDGQGISQVNPGLTYKVALVYEQAADWTRQPVHLDVQGLDFVHDDPLTLDADFWLGTGKVAASGTFDVEVRK